MSVVLRPSGRTPFASIFSRTFFLGHVVQRIADFALSALELLFEMLHDLGLQRVLIGLTLGAVERVERFVELFVGVLANRLVHVLADMVKLHFQLGLTHGFDYAVDKLDLLFDFLMREENAAEHFLLGNLARARLDHHDSVGGAERIRACCSWRAVRCRG